MHFRQARKGVWETKFCDEANGARRKLHSKPLGTCSPSAGRRMAGAGRETSDWLAKWPHPFGGAVGGRCYGSLMDALGGEISFLDEEVAPTPKDRIPQSI